MWDCKSWAVRLARKQSVRKVLNNRKSNTTTSWSNTISMRRRLWKHQRLTRQSMTPLTRLQLRKISLNLIHQASRRRIPSETLLSTSWSHPIPMKRSTCSTLWRQCTRENSRRKNSSQSTSTNSSPLRSCQWVKTQSQMSLASLSHSKIAQCMPRTTWSSWFAS